MLCYVFLFKQKTAYEMRISDWSSDVCSSDLLFRQKAQRQLITLDALRGLDFDRDQQHRPRKPRQHRGLRNAHIEQGLVLACEPAAPRQIGRQDEIGSASCRERVCQYV